MAMPHAASGDVIDVRPLGRQIGESQTRTLAKTDQLEIIRLVLPAGKEIPTHQVAGPITVQCLEGRVEFFAHNNWLSLEPGQLIYLQGGEPHALKSIADASVLVTIQLPGRSA